MRSTRYRGLLVHPAVPPVCYRAPLLALQGQLHPTLKRDAIVIEWKKNDGVEAGGGPTVVNTHTLLSL